MYRISSNWTAFLKLFLPTFWIVFFGSMTLGIAFSNPNNNPLLESMSFKLIFAACFLVFLLILYFTVMRLKRLDMYEDYFLATNYFKTFRYSYKAIKNMSEKDYGLFRVVKIELHKKSGLGKSLVFIPSKVRYNEFIETHPHLFGHLLRA